MGDCGTAEDGCQASCGQKSSGSPGGKDKDEEVAISAAEAVWSIDRRPDVLPCFVRGLKAKSANSRVRAVRNLMHMGAEAKPAVPDLIAACKGRDSSVRREAYRPLSVAAVQAAAILKGAESWAHCVSFPAAAPSDDDQGVADDGSTAQGGPDSPSSNGE